MITLKANNRVLVENSKFAYLIQNYASNVSSFQLSNTEPFVVGTPILAGEMGQPEAEILKVLTIDDEVITLGDENNVATTTNYAHNESTKIVAIQFDQIRFFWTAATGTISDENPTFSDSIALTDWTDMDPTSFYTTYEDADHSDGFGWFQYKNAISGETSRESNPIPYAGFSSNTVRQIFNDFDSGLNINELTLISNRERFAWLNEALSVWTNKLNLCNIEYTVSTPQTITTIADTAEYILPADFSELVEVTDDEDNSMPYMPVSSVLANNGVNPTASSYYLRGRYFGLTPTPTTTGTEISYTYRSKSTRVTSLSTYLDLPDNAFYSLTDYMQYKASMKFKDPLASVYYQSFKNAVDLFIQAAHKRDANLDSFGISNSANN